MGKKFFLKVFIKDARNMDEVTNNSIQLIVTSPPYFVGKPYGNMKGNLEYCNTFEEYLTGLNDVWKECYRVLDSGCRICIVVADTWRQPYIPLHSHIIQQMLKLFEMDGIIIWDKNTTGGRTSWGSWRLPSNPYVRDRHEFILIFRKKGDRKKPEERDIIEKSKIPTKEFLQMTQSIWYEKPDSASKVGHPAPFPIELIKRIIKFYTFVGETVLDPFLGSGTTLRACLELSRNGIGYEINPKFVPIIKRRINISQMTLEKRPKYDFTIVQ